MRGFRSSMRVMREARRQHHTTRGLGGQYFQRVISIIYRVDYRFTWAHGARAQIQEMPCSADPIEPGAEQVDTRPSSTRVLSTNAGNHVEIPQGIQASSFVPAWDYGVSRYSC